MAKQLKQFTFYDLYWKLIKSASDDAAGRIIKAMCKYVFADEQPATITDDKETFIWSNIEDILERVKQLESAGKTPKSYNKKMAHFAFVDNYYKAIRLMGDEDCGAYVKALCGYMFEGKEPKKLKPPVDSYYELAKTKLQLSKVRIVSGSKGGKAERVKVTDEQIDSITVEKNSGILFDNFMSSNPHIVNDLYASNSYLLANVDWAYLDMALEFSPYKKCTSLTEILKHRKEILNCLH